MYDLDCLGTFSIHYYETPEGVYLAFCPDLEEEDLKSRKIDPEFGLPYNQVIQVLKDLEIWGFIDEENCIHVWTSQETEISKILRFFGHEIGHLLYDYLAEDEACEDVADSYGFTVECAYTLSQKLLEIMEKSEEIAEKPLRTSEVNGLIFLPED